MSFFNAKVFLVTGASSGIGAALSEALCAEGAMVTGMARRADRLAELEGRCGGRFLAIAGDVTSEQDCRRAVEGTVAKFGKLDGLVHNAGISMRALAADSSMEVYRQLMEVDFFSIVHLFHAAGPQLRQNRGHLAAVSSMMGVYSTQMRSGYAAAKHALQGFMDSVRLELTADGVHVMTITPGFVQTEISLHALSADGSKHGVVDPAIAKGLLPPEVARVIMNGLRRRSRDVYPAGRKEKFGLFLSRFAPGLLDRLLLKSDVT